MKPSPSLCVRLRFSTKDVGKGFYRGNRTGSMGAHTPKGGYLIDYRKVRSYNVPNMKDFKLTPYVSREIGEMETPEESYDWEREYSESSSDYTTAADLSLARRVRAIKYLSEWRQLNPGDFNEYVEYQASSLEAECQRFLNGESSPVLERLYQKYQTRIGASNGDRQKA